MLIQFDTLERMFASSLDNLCLSFRSHCQSCGHELSIEIHKLSSGFGLIGGVLFESNSDDLNAECDACYQNNSNSNDTANQKSKIQYELSN